MNSVMIGLILRGGGGAAYIRERGGIETRFKTRATAMIVEIHFSHMLVFD